MSYTCLNVACSAPDSKKGKIYPSAMECPFCDAPLFAIVSLDETEITLINQLPYVIAYPLKRAVAEKHAWTRVNLLKDTFLNYMKYLGLVAASEFFNSPLKDKKMVALFQQALAEPSFGSWNQYIRETLKYLNEKQHPFFCSDLPKYYEAVETGNKRKLYKGEIEYIDSNGDVQLKKQEATAIGMLINFRNRYLGHGLTLDEKASQQLWDEYFPIFRTLLEQMQFAAHYPMFKNEHGETYRLQSSELTTQEKGTQTPARVWMENPQGESMDILPFFVVPGEVSLGKEDKEQILAYESYTGKTIKFFSPEGTEKQTSGKILEKLNLLLRDKQKEHTYTPEEFTKEVFLARVADENKLILDTLVAEKKVIPSVYVHREGMEIKLREWIGARANIFVIAAEAGSGKTNLLVEMQKQYTERDFPTLLIRAGRLEKTTLHAQLCYLLNIDERENLAQYPAIAGTQEAPNFVLIDGLNEAHDAEKLWTELFEISQHFEPGSLKFVVTSRANTAADINRYGITEDQETFLYGDNKDREKQVSAYTHWLAALSMLEMKQAWEYYVQKDKSKFKPQFEFDDLATFDRALYNQISNPLVLRLFLETYQGKNLPKKGKQHLNIWSDWLSSFSQPEQEFFNALANAIWEKGENELLLDDVLKDNNLHQSFTTDQLNAPYPRLRNLGWISRYVKDLNACVGFTVEGALLHLLGKKLEKQEPGITIAESKQLLQTGSPLQRAGVGAYLQHLALKGDLNTVCELIDGGEEFIEACVTPIVLHLKSIGVKETLDILLQNPTENDWKALLKVAVNLEKLELHITRKSLFLELMPYNNFKSKAAQLLALKTCEFVEKDISNQYLSLIPKDLDILKSDTDLLAALGDLEKRHGNFKKAFQIYMHGCVTELKSKGPNHISLVKCYNNIAEICIDLNNYSNALKYYKKSIQILNNNHIYDTRDFCEIYNNIGTIYGYIGNEVTALHYMHKCLNLQLKHFGARHTYISYTYNNIGFIRKKQSQFDKAIFYFEKSLDIRKNNFEIEHLTVANSFQNIGSTYMLTGDFKKAIEFLSKSLEIKTKNLGENHPSLATIYINMGNCHLHQSNYCKAIEVLKRGFIIFNGGYFPYLIAQCYEALSENQEALVYYIQSAEIRKEDPDAGIDDESTKQSIKACIRLAKELGKEEELPEWIKTYIQ